MKDKGLAKLMRAKEVMSLLDVSRYTLNIMAKSRTIRSVVLGDQRRYVGEDVQKLVNPSVHPIAFLSPKKAADILGTVSAKTVSRMADTGQVRSVVTHNGHRRIYAEDIYKLLDHTINEGADHAGAVTSEERVDPDQ